VAKNRNRGRGQQTYAAATRPRKNFVIAGTNVAYATGVATASSAGGGFSSWGGAVALGGGGVAGITQAVASPVPPAVPTGAPLPGEFEVDMIHGSVFFQGFNTTGVYNLGVGIYISQSSNPSGAGGAEIWDVRSLLSAQDAQSDDYLFLRVITGVFVIVGSLSGPQVVEIPIALPGIVRIGSRQAIHVQAENAGAGIVNAVFWYRSRVRRVN